MIAVEFMLFVVGFLSALGLIIAVIAAVAQWQACRNGACEK